MATGYLTSSTLIETVKRIGMIPTSQNTFNDSDFLAIANQEVRIGLLPTIIQYHEEYYVRDSADVTIVASQSRYPIPYRAVGGKFREIFYKDTSGNLRKMTRTSPDNRPVFQQSTSQSHFIFFFIEGNDVVLVPDVSTNPAGSLVFSYYMRPNELVDESRASTILSSSVGVSTTTFTVDSIPSNLTPFVQDGATLSGFALTSKLDVLQHQPGHKTISFDIYPTAIDTTNKTITFDNDDLGTGIISGDIVCFAGECIIPQVPADLHDVLAQRVMMRCLQSLGDAQGYQIAQSKLTEMNAAIGTLVDNRSEGNPQKINNLGSPLHTSKARRRNSW